MAHVADGGDALTFPALLALPLDPVVAENPVTMRVYLRLLSMLDFSEPRAVKAWALAEELRVRPQTASGAIGILISRGFLLDHGRVVSRTRKLTLVWAREDHLASKRTIPQA